MSAASPVYLDHNATTPPAPEVVDAMAAALREAWGNPSSAHPAGRAARAAVERAAAAVAALIGAEPDEIVFTSGGTEADDLAIHGVAASAPASRRRIVTSPIEHPAVSGAIEVLVGRGWQPSPQPSPRGRGGIVMADPPLPRIGGEGRGEGAPFVVTVLDLDAYGVVRVPAALPGDVALVTVMLANNETGAVQPIADLARVGRAVGAVVHTDAAQAVGKIPVDVQALGVDLLTLVGHKLYGPKGIGALYVRRGTALVPRLRGGGQQRGLRPGTEPVPSIVGLGVACSLAAVRLREDAVRQAALRDRLEQRLRAAIPGLVVTSEGAPRLPNTSFVRFPGATGSEVLARAPEIAASTGSACHDGISQASGVLLAMGVAPDDARGAVRLTVGRGTTDEDVERAAAALAAAWGGRHGA